MCCSIEPASFSNTLIYAAEAQHPSGKTVHVIGYQNKATGHLSGPNAMILPIPCEADSISSQNLVDASSFKGILESYDEAVDRLKPRRRSRGLDDDSLGETYGAAVASSYEVFDSGSYTVALVRKIGSAKEALSQVPEEKRPEIPTRFLIALGKLYPDWPLAFCCFNGNLGDPEPLFWWFEPKFPSVLFAPAIDAHDGNPPNPENIAVSRDHTLVFATHDSKRSQDRLLQEAIEDTVPGKHQWMFHSRIVGTHVKRVTDNGDFSLPLSVFHDEAVPSYLPRIDITPPPKLYPTLWERISE
jgi:hypothetical protein